ncbi:MAG: PD-(D/E)XK nuclease family protein [Eubacteriales bacterium]
MITMKFAPNLGALMATVLGSACAGGGGQVMIVPEQLTHQMERNLCAKGGATMSRRAEVLSFSRLANRVSGLYGGVARPVLDKGGRMLAMALALEQIASKLRIYGGGLSRPDMLLRLLSAVDELKSDGITPTQMAETAKTLTGQLAVKTEELSLILDSYQTVLSTMGFDPADQLLHLAKQLEEQEFAEGKTFYILGFSDFTGQELAVLRQLMNFGDDVTFCLVTKVETEDDADGLVWETHRQLMAICNDLGSDVQPVWLPRVESSTVLQQVQYQVFSGGNDTLEEETDAVGLHQSQGLYPACIDLAGKLRKAVQNGFRWRDLAVCCTQMEQAKPILSALFSTFDIPAYFAGNTSMAEKPVVSMVLAALDSATGNLEREDVLRYLKSGLSQLSMEQCDRLENYAFTWNISGAKWGKPWVMHPKGYGCDMDEKTEQQLAELNEIRHTAITPILNLQKNLRTATDTAGQILALYDFLEAIHLAEQLEDLRQSASPQQAQEYGQFYDVILTAMEQIYQVLGKTVRKPEDFAKIVDGLLHQYDVGTIPATADRVEVGNVASMRFSQCKQLFVLGADDGIFPSQATERSLLSEWERKTLQGAGLPMASQENLQLERELGATDQVLSSCHDRLILYTYGNRPSMIFHQIQAQLPHLELEQDEEFPSIYWANPVQLGGFLAGKHLSLEGKQGWEDYAKAILKQASHQLGSLSETVISKLYGGEFRLSASKVDKFATCPCAYFLHYGLKLQPEKQATFDASIYGTFVHWVLEQTTKEVEKLGGFHNVDGEKLVEITDSIMESYEDDTVQKMLAESPRFHHIYRRNFEEVRAVALQLGDELSKSDFQPGGYELEFSAKGQLPAVEIQGEKSKATLVGFVDRVDFHEHNNITYGRVVDYKTGKKALDYTDMASGLGLQMLLYLFALCDGGEQAFGTKIKPAGVLYFPARREIFRETAKKTAEEAADMVRKNSTRSGLISSNPAILEAMEHHDGIPQYLPYRTNSKGDLVGDVADESQMRLLKNHVFRAMASMTDRMAEGAVAPEPLDRGPDCSPCNYCDFSKICHEKSGELERNTLKKTTSKEFWAQLEQEDDHG